MKLRWICKRIKDYTLEDAINASMDGVNFICADGKLLQIKGLHNLLDNVRKEVG